MNFKVVINKSLDFAIKRIAELIGISFIIISLLIITSLISYAPEDPNFIFPEDTNIKNVLGYRGSFISDLFYQSLGLMSVLVCFTIFFTGIIVFKNKRLLVIVENFFYTILYILVGSLFLSTYYPNSFLLSMNGNGGFVGIYLKNSFLFSFININNEIFYYILIFLVLFIFLISINFSIKYFINFLKTIFLFIFRFSKKEKNKNINTEIYESDSNYTQIEKSEKFIQEDLPFSKSVTENAQKSKFKLPPIDLLNIVSKKEKAKDFIEEKNDENLLEKILLDFGVEGKIKKVSRGPVVTLNEFEPAAGIKVSKIINLSEDIARNTSSESARISTIPGRSTVGIELPNSERESVFLSEIISSSNFQKKDIKLPIALGKSISGLPIIGDLSSMPHLLIAGTTGSGKSVCINTIILSLLYKHSPEKCKFILIDPKMLELSTYEGIPHLLCPVITEAKRSASVLGWVVKEMESRYKLMTRVGVKNIDGYNSKHKISMPYIVVIVDEMSDLMLVAGKEIEGYIQKLSQMARAAGIHIIMATQRPSVDVITGTIKANFNTRISFQVTSKIDSRTFLGEQGAEQLLG